MSLASSIRIGRSRSLSVFMITMWSPGKDIVKICFVLRFQQFPTLSIACLQGSESPPRSSLEVAPIRAIQAKIGIATAKYKTTTQ